MKRHLLIIVVFLLLGAVVNVAVAWGSAAWAPRPARQDSVLRPQFTPFVRAGAREDPTQQSVESEEADSTPSGPDRVITRTLFQGNLAFQPRPGSSSGFVIERENAINLWAVFVYYWPELLAGLVTLVGLFMLWRTLRRPRIPGEPYCRRCNYRLTGAATDKCPECGATLTAGNRVIGRRRRLRLVSALVIVVGLPTSYGLWLRALPREGAFSYRWNWWSMGLYDWAKNRQLTWLTDRATLAASHILERDLATGKPVRVLCWLPQNSSRLLASPDASRLFARTFTRSGGSPRLRILIIDGQSGRIRSTIPLEPADLQLTPIAYAASTDTLYLLSPGDEVLYALECENKRMEEFVTIDFNKRNVTDTGYSLNPPIVLGVPPDNMSIVIAEYDGSVSQQTGPYSSRHHWTYKIDLWDGSTRRLVATLDKSLPVMGLVVSPDGKRLIASIAGKGIQAWSLDQPEKDPWVIVGDETSQSVGKLAISPDGRYLFGASSFLTRAAGGPGGSIYIFDLVSTSWVGERTLPAGAYVSQLSVSGDGKHIAAHCSLGRGGWLLAIYDLPILQAEAAPGSPADGAAAIRR